MFILLCVLCVLVPLPHCDMLRLNGDVLLDLEFAKQLNVKSNLTWKKSRWVEDHVPFNNKNHSVAL